MFVEEIQCNMAPLMVKHSTFKDMVLYSTESGPPMIMSQEPILVKLSHIY